ncbi:MAG: hypothetical protein J1E60_02240 [Christensenellaceae bacterium]|nr:hypothetical protein [Christensenellaceae bacterium]
MNKRLFGLCAVVIAAFGICTACNVEPDVIIDINSPSTAPVPTVVSATNPGLFTPAPPTEPPYVDPTDIPEITQAPQLDYSVFNNCAFVGNSTFEGLYKYGVITQGSFFTRVGLNILSVYKQTTSTGSIPIIDELNTGNYEAVILMFGENELGWPNLNTFINKYSDLLDDVWQRQPGCEIFIMGIPPVSESVSSSSTTGVTNENIQLYNAQLVDLATRRGCHFVSVPESLMTSNGALPPEASSDGLHLNLQYSKLWADHICLTVMSVLR